MKVSYAGTTHVGLKRTHNEDNFFLLPEENVYIVADGMGGHSSGEVASQIAVETLANFFIDTSRDREITWPCREDKTLNYDENRLVTGIKLANRRVFETAQSDIRYRGMGTTIVSLVCGGTGAYLAHVGDSRAYVLRSQRLELLTEDHSLLNDYLKIHELSAEEIEQFPHKNVIVRALGMKDSVKVDIQKLHPKIGELYLLCSDGLSGMVQPERMQDILLKHHGDLEKSCQTLINEANNNGGADNITVVLVDFTV